jgi:hypothetical protein
MHLSWTNIHSIDPPLIGKIVDQTLVEGDALNFSCPVIPGNPNNTQIKWTTSIDFGEKWLTQFLVISNVSRKHDIVYICTVNNTMAPTFEPVEIGWNSESFHLTVECMYIIMFKFLFKYKCNYFIFDIYKSVEEIRYIQVTVLYYKKRRTSNFKNSASNNVAAEVIYANEWWKTCAFPCDISVKFCHIYREVCLPLPKLMFLCSCVTYI